MRFPTSFIRWSNSDSTNEKMRFLRRKRAYPFVLWQGKRGNNILWIHEMFFNEDKWNLSQSIYLAATCVPFRENTYNTDQRKPIHFVTHMFWGLLALSMNVKQQNIILLSLYIIDWLFNLLFLHSLLNKVFWSN